MTAILLSANEKPPKNQGLSSVDITLLSVECRKTRQMAREFAKRVRQSGARGGESRWGGVRRGGVGEGYPVDKWEVEKRARR